FELRRQSEEEMRHFVSDASHELRTPLTSIAGYIDVLGRRESVDSETLQASLAAMQQESSRMTRLVNDLLTLTRFESGKAPQRQRLPLDHFLNQALDELHLPICERIDRGEQARDRSTRASGLGLAIAKSIVEAHHGSIEAASEPGQGATFTAWLPLAA